jgi:pimeloyl-ACP methyl ester carboxylesterase
VIFLTLFLIFLVLLALADRLAPFTVTRFAIALERRLSGLKLQHAQVSGFTMPYLEGGSGQTLILIHGFGGDKDNFTRLARHLVAHYHVIIPDLPGFGDAGRDPAAKYTIAEQVTRMHIFLQQLNLSKVAMGGNSMGGFISAQFAATYPHMVSNVWLLDPAGTEEATRSDVIQNYLKTGKMPLLVQTHAGFEELMRAATWQRPFIPYSLRHVLGARAIADFALHSAIMAQFTQSPLLEEQYSNLTTPALVVWGDHDLILHPDGAQATARLFLHSKVIIMRNIGHLPMLEAPRTTALNYLAYRQELAKSAQAGQ